MDAERWRAAKLLLQEALEQDEPERRAWLESATSGDPALRDELVELLAAHAEAGDRFEQAPLAGTIARSGARDAGEAPPQRVGSYRLLRELGRGGMGTVYLGVREGDELSQPVAVKVIRRGMDSEVIVRRFRIERQILASLHHPGIARLYEGGTTEAGSPYFVMEYIEGLPLDSWCESRDLSVDERLRLFQQVCVAVQVAHQNLIVHRDLKPGNIFVTAEGVPKLLDFGIAKLLDPEAAPGELDLTAADRPLTPEYASPEQVRGEAMTTASDLYSLGVVLYRLLTGEMPYRFVTRSPQEVLRVVGETVPDRPSTAVRKSAGEDPERRSALSRRLAGDLDTIVLKALHKDPARRYASAEQLAEDIERHLSGFPVRARPDSVGYRLAKFVGRHRIGVGVSALAVLVLVATTGFALRQASLANLERARAERRFADVRRLANVVLFDVHASLENVAGAMPARRLLVENALRYLDDLAREAGDEPALLLELATAYERVGEVQGMPGWPSGGRTGDALASFERALSLRRRLGGASGGVPDEARLLLRIGSVQAARGETSAALGSHRAARVALEARAGAGSAPIELRLELAQALVAEGDDVWELGDVPEAAKRYGEALGVAKSASAHDPESTLAIRQVGVVEQRLGDAAAEVGEWERALDHHRASLAIDRRLEAGAANDAEIQRDLGTDLSRMGVAEAKLGHAAESLAQHRAALALRERLLEREPDDARALEDVAESRLETGKALARLGHLPEGIAEVTVAIERRRLLCDRDPGNARWQDGLALALTTRAALELERGARDAAGIALGEAVSVRRDLASRSPDFAGNREPLAELERALERLSSTRSRSGLAELSAALAAWR